MTKQSKKAEELTDIEKLKDPFDKLFRRSMQEKKIAIELLKTYLPAELVEKIDFSTLTLLNGSTLSEEPKTHACRLCLWLHDSGARRFHHPKL
ncbi:MAG: Rpn family recombination-promoting nuclease/putative transposase [Candidatus Symbiodolus clandestinus]